MEKKFLHLFPLKAGREVSSTGVPLKEMPLMPTTSGFDMLEACIAGTVVVVSGFKAATK